jgi:hypothetical protein
MAFTTHKDRKYGGTYLKIGNKMVAQYDVPRLWELMCGEEAIKAFLAKCEKDDKYTVPELKKVN